MDKEQIKHIWEREFYCEQDALVWECLSKEVFSEDDILNIRQEVDIAELIEEYPDEYAEFCANFPQYERFKEYLIAEEGLDEEDFWEYVKPSDETWTWFAISRWLANRMEEAGLIVLRNDYGDWFARQTVGQMITSDSFWHKLDI